MILLNDNIISTKLLNVTLYGSNVTKDVWTGLVTRLSYLIFFSLAPPILAVEKFFRIKDRNEVEAILLECVQSLVRDTTLTM